MDREIPPDTLVSIRKETRQEKTLKDDSDTGVPPRGTIRKNLNLCLKTKIRCILVFITLLLLLTEIFANHNSTEKIIKLSQYLTKYLNRTES